MAVVLLRSGERKWAPPQLSAVVETGADDRFTGKWNLSGANEVETGPDDR